MLNRQKNQLRFQEKNTRERLIMTHKDVKPVKKKKSCPFQKETWCLEEDCELWNRALYMCSFRVVAHIAEVKWSLSD